MFTSGKAKAARVLFALTGVSAGLLLSAGTAEALPPANCGYMAMQSDAISILAGHALLEGNMQNFWGLGAALEAKEGYLNEYC